MKVFIDLHHFDLFYSFQLLFGKRLGWEVWRPIGYDWIENGYWAIHDHPLIQQGYLGQDVELELDKWSSFKGQSTWARHASEVLRIGKTELVAPGIYRVLDKSKDIWQHAITFDAFRDTKFDVIISTVPQHYLLFEKLKKEYQPRAKHIFQAGNAWSVPEGCQNMMFSSVPSHVPAGTNTVKCHQEFDLDVFCPLLEYSDAPFVEVNSYVHFPQSESLMMEVMGCLSSLRSYLFSFVGKTEGYRKDIIIKTEELARKIRNSSFTWIYKPGGESFGHILHNSFATGTPVIVSLSQYRGFCGLDLLENGVTCIDLDQPVWNVANMIEKVSFEEEMCAMRHRVFQRFEEVVNFDEEFERIRTFLENLK